MDRSRKLVLAALMAIVMMAVGCSSGPIKVSGPTKVSGPGTKLSDGLEYWDLKAGSGDMAVPRKTVTVNYTGWLTDGTKFDSSLDRNQPYPFVLGTGHVIPGWDEGLVGMKVGGKRQLRIPPDLGYGARGMGSIPPNANLVFDVELLDVK